MGKVYDEDPFMYKRNCEDCGSSDACAVYASGNTHCFSCDITHKNREQHLTTGTTQMSEYNPSVIEYATASIRDINTETLKKFSYGRSGEKHITYYFDDTGSIVAEKYRTKDKDFSWNGNAKSVRLFGSQLWKPHKKISITITEGEIDAMSISQLQNNMYPVVSVPNGAAAAVKDVKKSIEWLLGFKEVVLCFDNDKVGQEAANKVAKLFPPKFVRIASLPLKDANEMLRKGRGFDLKNCLRDAKPFTPDGIISGVDIMSRLENETKTVSFPFPDFMEDTNNKTLGIRLGELDTYTSGTGSGKTTLIKQLQLHYFKTTDMNQALIHLEEPLEHTARDLVGMEMGTRLQFNDEVDKETYIDKARDLFTATDTEGYNRFCLYDSFGSMDAQDLYNKIRFMVNGLNCKVIWLDHLSILVSGLGSEGDERRIIDSIMHELKSLTVELGCYIGLIVHLNNNTQTPFENGGVPTLNNLRGSGGIKQLSNSVYSFSRNQQAEDDTERNTSLFSVLKCRYTGQTGPADYMHYNGSTGRLEKGYKPIKGESSGGENDF